MAKIKDEISGMIVSPRIIEIENNKKNKLLPGQKVLIYKNTGKNIVGASGRILGKKERVLGIGEVKLSGCKVIVESEAFKIATPITFKTKGAVIEAAKKTMITPKIKKNRLKRYTYDKNVFIKPIEE